jgi:nicotinamidase-related amidase
MSSFLKKEDTLLLVVDIQERLCAAMEKEFKATFMRNSRILMETARAASMPMVVSEQYPRGLGRTIPEIAELTDNGAVLEKLFFSCYRDQALKARIDSFRKQAVVICGIETHVCVMQTALDLMFAGYTVAVAGDAVCSRRMTDRIASLEAMARQGILVYPTETIAFMIMEKAGTELFKRISPLFREV